MEGVWMDAQMQELGKNSQSLSSTLHPAPSRKFEYNCVMYGDINNTKNTFNTLFWKINNIPDYP